MPRLCFKNFKNWDLWSEIFQIAAISIFCYDFLINLINNDALFRLWRPTRASWFILSACLWKRTCWRCSKITVLNWFLAQVVWMREEYNSVLSTPTEADKISRFGRYWYIGPFLHVTFVRPVMFYGNFQIIKI